MFLTDTDDTKTSGRFHADGYGAIADILGKMNKERFVLAFDHKLRFPGNDLDRRLR